MVAAPAARRRGDVQYRCSKVSSAAARRRRAGCWDDCGLSRRVSLRSFCTNMLKSGKSGGQSRVYVILGIIAPLREALWPHRSARPAKYYTSDSCIFDHGLRWTLASHCLGAFAARHREWTALTPASRYTSDSFAGSALQGTDSRAARTDAAAGQSDQAGRGRGRRPLSGGRP